MIPQIVQDLNDKIVIKIDDRHEGYLRAFHEILLLYFPNSIWFDFSHLWQLSYHIDYIWLKSHDYTFNIASDIHPDRKVVPLTEFLKEVLPLI